MLDIYRRAVSYFGATKQKLKAIEEMAELIVELIKDLLGDGNPAKVIEELAAYEDTGLEPEEVKDAIRIAERIAMADYPHNFQRERSDIADYMRWITDVMRDAKAWWNGRIKTRAEAEKAMEGVTDDA